MQPNSWPRAAIAFVVAHVVCVSNPEFQLHEHVQGVKNKQQTENSQQEAHLMIAGCRVCWTCLESSTNARLRIFSVPKLNLKV